MNLPEYKGKELFVQYGIQVPKGKVVSVRTAKMPFVGPFVLKSQVLSSDRRKKGGVVFGKIESEFQKAKRALFQTPIDGEVPQELLFEEQIVAKRELYLSFSYDTEARAPALSVSKTGGSGVKKATVAPIDLVVGFSDFVVRDALFRAGLEPTKELKSVIHALWQLFVQEHALVAEINPLFETQGGNYIAGDAKVVLDDNVVATDDRPFLDLPGDIAVLASGGGASMINLDALMRAGGEPANYVEYSGNPLASVVEELTVKVLSKPGLKGCWTVGGTANFTDIFETMSGFVAGLRRVRPKPTYPIVIRRDGPRREEAFVMLQKVAKEEGYDFHLFGPETPMSQSAEEMVRLIKRHEHSR